MRSQTCYLPFPAPDQVIYTFWGYYYYAMFKFNSVPMLSVSRCQAMIGSSCVCS
jgi:hypothetical protein